MSTSTDNCRCRHPLIQPVPRNESLKLRTAVPIGINVVDQIVRVTSLRGWVLIGLVAAAAYFLLGIVAAFAWILGAVAGLSASTPWEADTDHEPRVEPMHHDGANGGAGAPAAHWWNRSRLNDDRMRFQRFSIIANCCPPDRLRPAYS